FPALTDALEALRAIPADDIDRVGPATRAVLEARSAAFPEREPIALVYAGVLVRVVRRGLDSTFSPVSLPALEEIHSIVRAHGAPDLGSILWWETTIKNRLGQFANAEVAAREMQRLASLREPDRPEGFPTRDTPLAGTLIGQGRFAEAEPMLF